MFWYLHGNIGNGAYIKICPSIFLEKRKKERNIKAPKFFMNFLFMCLENANPLL